MKQSWKGEDGVTIRSLSLFSLLRALPYRVDVAAVRCRKPFPDAYVSPTSFAQRMSQIEALFVRSFLTAPKSVSVAKFCDPILRAVAAA